uniref:Uncharacterized protein n=1 Tax=Bellilinea caldifistulae TaxID=360411 RepID=A0A7C4Q390_9CHLR
MDSIHRRRWIVRRSTGSGQLGGRPCRTGDPRVYLVPVECAANGLASLFRPGHVSLGDQRSDMVATATSVALSATPTRTLTPTRTVPPTRTFTPQPVSPTPPPTSTP